MQGDFLRTAIDADLGGRIVLLMRDIREQTSSKPISREVMEEWIEEILLISDHWDAAQIDQVNWRSPAMWAEIIAGLNQRLTHARAMMSSLSVAGPELGPATDED